MSTRPHHQEQIGDYVLILDTPVSFWRVRMAGSDETPLGRFNSKREAKAAIARYIAADRRRARETLSFGR